MARASNDKPPTPSADVEDLEDLFEHAPCGYVSTEASGRIIKANETLSSWTGFRRDQLLGMRFQDLLSIAGKIYYETHFGPLLRMQGFFNEVALDLVCAGGRSLPVLVNAVERRDDSGGLRFIRITIFNASDRRRYEKELLEARRTAEKAGAELRDLNSTLEARIAEAVRDRLQAEDSLRQAQKMEAVGRLTGGIAHDFNNMLAVVLAGLSLLERRLATGDADVGKYISAARDAANKAAALTHRLLAFSRRQSLAPQVLDANALVSEMSELLRRTLGEAVRLETVFADGLWPLHADANQLENAIVNLAVNARDAMPGGGRLTVETANTRFDDAHASEIGIAPGDYVMIAVADTGVGMTPDIIAKAFDPFFTTKAVGKGTGLGLSQVFGFVKQSGGHVEIHSQPGHGTAVKIYLPRFCGAAEAREASIPAFAKPGERSEVILVVEDDDQLRRLTAQMIWDLGYGILTARSGAEALHVLDSHPEIRLLFTDVVMPDMSGPQLAEAARDARPDLKVLFTTGYAKETAAKHGFSEPDARLLAKPASLEELGAHIRALLDA